MIAAYVKPTSNGEILQVHIHIQLMMGAAATSIAKEMELCKRMIIIVHKARNSIGTTAAAK
jgi:hypothetical protein